MASQVRPKPVELWYREPGRPRTAGRATVVARLKPSSTARPIPRALRYAVLARDQHRCQRCAVDVRTISQHSVHHRDPRGMGGRRRPDTLPELILLCGSGSTRCHGAVESDRALAEEQGFLLAAGAVASEVPVVRFAATDAPSLQLLTADGWVPAVAA